MSLTQISDGRGEVGTANTTLPQRECWKLGNRNCLETPCTPLYSVVLHVLYCTNHQTSACFNHSLRPVQDAENQFSRVSPFSPRRMGKRMVLEFDDMSSCSTIRVTVPHQCVVLRSKSPPTSTAFKLEQNKQLNLELNGWL